MERKLYFEIIKKELINSPIVKISLFFTILSILMYLYIRQISMPIAIEKPSLTPEQKIGSTNEKIKTGNYEKQNPEFIKDFTVNTLTNLLTWRLYSMPVSGEDIEFPRIDPGIAIKVNDKASVRIPTSVWESTSAKFDDLGGEFLSKELAPLILSLNIIQGASATTFIPIDVQDPIEIKANKLGERLWKVRVNAKIVMKKNPTSQEEVIPFAKDVYIKYVAAPVSSSDELNYQKESLSQRIGSLKVYKFR
jgi:hypothetical protein